MVIFHNLIYNILKNDVISAQLTDIWTVEDETNDRALALGLKEVKKGSLMVTYHIPDKTVWNHIKENGYNGFSLEGKFKTNRIELSEKRTIEDIIADIKNEISNINGK